MLVDLPFHEDGDEEKEEMGAKNEEQKGIEDDGYAYELDEIFILCCEVHQADEHESLHGFSKIEMDSDVLSFVRLAVDCEGEIGGMH